YAAFLRVALGLLWPASEREPGAAVLHRRLGFLSGLVFLTMLAGGFVAGLNAGLTYNTFPLMDGRFVPAGYLQLSPWWANLFENVATVQFDHRLLAETTFTVAILFFLSSLRLALTQRGRWAMAALLGAALLQFGLGIATLLLAVPVALGAL